MKTLCMLFLAAAVLLFSLPSSSVASKKPEDVLYFKDGRLVRGTIIERTQNNRVKIKMANGKVRVYKMSEIEEIRRENANDADDPEDNAADVVEQKKPSVPETGKTPRSYINDRRTFSFSAPPKYVVGVNPLGFALGGLSWIGFEGSIGYGLTFQARLDLWKLTIKDGGYTENQSGFGGGVSVRGYLSGSETYSGLWGAFGIDIVRTTWDWTDADDARYYPYVATKGSGETITFVFSTQLGGSIAISNFRIEPSVIAGYGAMKETGKKNAIGIFIGFGLELGYAF